MKTKKPANPVRMLLEQYSHPIWPSLPVTIKLLKNNRNKLTSDGKPNAPYPARRGINATIILLSATCVEGFLVDSLMTFVSWFEFFKNDDLKTRLYLDLSERISGATFKDLQDLFTLTLGKTIKDLINDDQLIESIRSLIAFRNGIAHCRSFAYSVYASDINDIGSGMETEIKKQYRQVIEYIRQRDLIAKNNVNPFMDEVADHFSDLIFPYMDAVVKILPQEQIKDLKTDVDWAKKQ
jgi:hypothetical protein